ncbi:phosphotriesterase-related protein-like [Eupeodes corollae]|uniref:phosphotriesterase-related protein-like n=1 Tax=Eupeodes corollae TaxID=290404 RepID=UPI002491EB20|nr:phosphotriesterase-related protein-like [Eupeodes corollae]
MSFVQTVLGPISPNLLGRTLTHEHFQVDLEKFHCSPPTEYKEYFDQKISLETIGFVAKYPYASLENITFCDEATRSAVRKDVELYKKFGGGSIVENTSIGLKRNLEFMVDIQKTTGVNIVAGTGHYLHNHQTPDDLAMTVEEMTNLYTKEIVTGIDVENVGPVKCGFIGEVGSDYPIHDFEKRAIRATGETQEAVGCGVSFHPGPDVQAPFEIVRMYLEAGGRPDKCVMSHLDLRFMDMEELFEFATLGTYMQYDLFGVECSFFHLVPSVDMPSDAQRMKNLMLLIEDGFLEKIQISQDIHSKHRLTSFGGHGYHHIHKNIVPRLITKGLTMDQVVQIIVKNPAKWLEIKE